MLVAFAPWVHLFLNIMEANLLVVYIQPKIHPWCNERTCVELPYLGICCIWSAGGGAEQYTSATPNKSGFGHSLNMNWIIVAHLCHCTTDEFNIGPLALRNCGSVFKVIFIAHVSTTTTENVQNVAFCHSVLCCQLSELRTLTFGGTLD